MLENKSVLIIEDEFLIAELLEDMLRELGGSSCSVITNIPDANSALDAGKPDLVILDLNLAGESALPIAVRLREENTRFIFSSGYDPAMLDVKWQSYPVLMKPYTPEQLAAKIAQAFTR